MSLGKQIAPGGKPAKGTIVELCRYNTPGESTVVESFTADGEWSCPETQQGFFYRGHTETEAREYLRKQFGV